MGGIAGTKPFRTELADAKKALWIGVRVDVQVFKTIASDIGERIDGGQRIPSSVASCKGP